MRVPCAACYCLPTMRIRSPSVKRSALVVAHCLGLLGGLYPGAGIARALDSAEPPVASTETAPETLTLTPKRRNELRREARTSTESAVRAAALRALSREDASVATGRICVRALRTDEAPAVRRAAAECLGHLPHAMGTSHTSALMGALADDHVDVVTMAAWALGRVGDAAALEPVHRLRGHPDPRVVTLAQEYEALLVARHGALTRTPSSTTALVGPDDDVHRRAQGRAQEQNRNVEVLATAVWLTLSGGMSGWVYGGLLGAAHLGNAGSYAAVGALGGALGGAAFGGGYALGRKPRLFSAFRLTELAAFGGLAGYGVAALSSPVARRGNDLANFSTTGALLGTGFALVLDSGREAGVGNLAAGLSAALATGAAAGVLVFGAGGDLGESAASALAAGGSAGLLAAVVPSSLDDSVAGWFGAGLGGASLACVSGLVVATAASFTLPAEVALGGTALATVAGGATGALLGGMIGQRFLRAQDPFLHVVATSLNPQISLVADPQDTARTLPLVGVGGLL